MKGELFYGSCSESASGTFRAVTGTTPGSVAHSPIPGLTEAEGLERLRRLVEHRSDLAATRAALETLGLLHGTEGEVTVAARGVEPARGMGGGGPV